MSTNYTALGALLAEARLGVGLKTQADLAAILRIKQQSVSRWEAGASRPRPDQIPELAQVLKLDPALLMEKAGYAAAPPISVDQLFPVDQLAPETFERFVQYLVDHLHRGAADVRRAGASGHKQDGVDVIAALPDGSLHIFQCKRHKQFGPAEVAKMIEAYTGDADVKHLVLSRVASPHTAEAVKQAGWTLWDKEDITRIVRTKLTPDDQERIVDIFFHGQRLALLGRPEPGPWVTDTEFYAPFEGRTKAFTHDYPLRGRKAEISQVVAALEDPDARVVMLAGAGGMGKSRVLKEALQTFQEAHPAVTVRLLSLARDIRVEDLEKLGAGPKVLVVDDAHDRDGLGGLLHFAASNAHTTVLLVTRPYAEARLTREAAIVSLTIAQTIRLQRLTRDDSIALAREVLHAGGGDPDFAEDIVDNVGDNPLITVMAAHVIAAEKAPLEIAKNAQTLRNTVLGKFEKVIIGDLGAAGDEMPLKNLIEVLALVQPFHIDDPALISLLEELKGINKIDAARLLRILVEGGLVYLRGGIYRLMPDLLGDYILEQSCRGPNNRLSPFAEQAFAAVDGKQLEHVLVNLGRMDWRLAGGDPAKSDLLDGIWVKLRDIQDEYDTRLDAIAAVAIYQPRQALAFAEYHVRKGTKLSGLAQILRSISYHSAYTEDASAALWELGKDDTQKAHYKFENAVDTLAKLCAFEDGKPLDFNERIFAFALELSRQDEAWRHLRSPLEIMLPVLATEGVSTSSSARTVTMSPFLISYDNVKPLRDRLISRMLELVEHPDLHIAYRAALAFDTALRAPHGLMRQHIDDKLRAKYNAEFVQTIEALSARAERLSAPALIALAASLSWLSEHGAAGPKKAARAFIKHLPKTLAFRTIATLVKGSAVTFGGREYDDDFDERTNTWITELTAELKRQHPGESLLDVLEAHLQTLKRAGVETIQSHALVANVVRGDLELARRFIARVRRDPTMLIGNHLAAAIFELLSDNPAEGHDLADDILDSAEAELGWAVAGAFGPLRRKLDKRDQAILKRALASTNANVVANAVRALFSLRRDEKPRTIISLLKAVDFRVAARIADDVFMLFRGKTGIMDALTKKDVEHFLSQLRETPEINGHYAQEFLAHVSEHFPFELIDLFLERVEIAVAKNSYGFHPAPFGPYSHVPLRFGLSADASAVLAHVWLWLRKNSERQGYVFYEQTGNLFEAIFPADAAADLAGFFDTKLDTATRGELKLMSRLLRKAGPEFVFAQRAFVVRFLDRCRAVDPALVESAVSNLSGAARSGVWGGQIGVPDQREVRHRDESSKILSTLSKFSPAYELFDYLHKTAVQSLSDRALQHAALDEE
jgi:transcriptional regulator with XRE-family HTH domain